MKSLWSFMAFIVFCVVTFQSDANDDFNNGMRYARELKGKDIDAFKSFKPADNLPDYNSNPDVTKYYGGVRSNGVDLTSPGNNTLNNTDWGKAVIDSVSKQPEDMVTPDSPFLDNGRKAENNAETVFDPKLCESKEFEKSVFTNYVCDRDLQVEQYCTRTARMELQGSTTWETRTLEYEMSQLPAREVNGQYVVSITSPVTGEIVDAHYSWRRTYLQKSIPMTITVLGTPLSWNAKYSADASFTPVQKTLTAGVAFTSSHPVRVGNTKFRRHTAMKLRLVVRVKKASYTPYVVWSESCPFSKEQGKMVGTECTEAGGTRTLVKDGQSYSLYQSCWAYRDSYLTQSESDGTCGNYIHKPACNVINQKCVDYDNGACLHANITYSCETKTKGKGQVCGDELFCTDGSCVLDSNGKNDMFARAVSELAAAAAAGKDVASLNSSDVKIFTGKGISCKKFAVGFSNCCKDSGWGQDMGLSSCSSEEKALGKAKQKRLTVYVGEYCSKKALGVCVEKKRGYCQFGSKLAQIVQQQGRLWQLGIGFGSGKSPDCRGITPEELQRINFSKIDFSAFYDDLNNGSDIPGDNSQMEKMKARMKALFDQGSSH